MTLTGHLEELRSRLIWSLGAWAVAAAGCYYFTPSLLAIARDRFLGPNVQLIFTRPTEAFFAYLKVAMVAGLFVASPIILYHVLMFVLPGMEAHERKWLWRLMPVAIVLFALGATFAYLVVLPVTMHFFLSFSTEELNAMFTIGEFLGFVVGILTLCGVAFQLPLVLFFAALAGIVNSTFLRQQRRFAIFAAFLIAAIATPTPDAFTMSVVAVPIWILFEISLILMRFVGK